MYLKLRLHLSTLIIRNVCYLRNFPRPSNAFIHFQGLRRSSGIPGSPGLPGSCMRSTSSNTTTPTVFCAPGKRGLKAIKGDNRSRWLPDLPGPRRNRGPRGNRGNEDHVGKRVTLGPQGTFLIWNVSSGSPVGWIEVSGSINIPRSIGYLKELFVLLNSSFSLRRKNILTLPITITTNYGLECIRYQAAGIRIMEFDPRQYENNDIV